LRATSHRGCVLRRFFSAATSVFPSTGNAEVRARDAERFSEEVEGSRSQDSGGGDWRCCVDKLRRRATTFREGSMRLGRRTQ
jgi:hypothetical protein